MDNEIGSRVLKILKKIQERKTFNPQPKEEDLKENLRLFKYFPSMAGFIKYIDKAGFDVSESLNASQVATGFHIADLVLALINFVSIPVNYFLSFLLGKKVSLSLSNAASFSYAAIILGLGLTALLVPGVREICAIVLAFVVAGTALIALTNFYYERDEIKGKLLSVNQDISIQQEQFELLQCKAKNLKNSFDEAVNSKLFYKAERLYKELCELEEKYDAQCQSLQSLHDLKFHYEKKLEDMDNSKIKDKCVGVILASIGLVGGIVAIFFPPVGLGILGITAFLGIGYTLTRVLSPFVNKLMAKIKNKFSSTPTPQETIEKDEVETLKENENLQLTSQFSPEQNEDPFTKKDTGIAGIMENYFTHHLPTKENNIQSSSIKSANDEDNPHPHSHHH